MPVDKTFPQLPLKKQCHKVLDQYHTFSDVQYTSTKIARELLVRLNRRTQRPISERFASLPPEIWLSVLGYLGDDTCVYCKHSTLQSLSLVCRFFSYFASEALYQTLDLRFNGSRPFLESRTPCMIHPNVGYYPPTMKLLRSKLDKLYRTLRAQPAPRSRIRHLKLPERTLCDSGPIYEAKRHGCILTDMHIKWVRIFKLCSSTLETISGLEPLWVCLHAHKRLELQNDIWIGMRENHNWTGLDFSQWSTSEFEASELKESLSRKMDSNWSDLRLMETFRGWTALRHVCLRSSVWSQGGLGLLPKLESVAIQTDGFLDFGFTFRYIPVNRLKSLSVISDLSKYQWSSPISEPFRPLIEYLQNCQLQASLSTPSMVSAITSLEITHHWSDKIHTIPGLPSVEELAFAIFTSAPLLRRLTIDITTFHERIVEPPDAFSRNPPSWPADFVVPHLRFMSVSIPARNSKEWLAVRIASGTFPNLSTFVFRSGLSRRQGVCLCNCVPCFREAFRLHEFAKEQDAVLVQACRKACISDWKMVIPDRTQIVCDPLIKYGKICSKGFDFPKS